MIPADFHFLRPEWLLALLPAALLAALVWRRLGTGGNAWGKLVDAHLLRHLAMSEERGARKWPVVALLLGWGLASLAMAGPTWRKLPTPALDRIDPTVVVLSLAQSMNAQDQSPSRLGAARHKVEDILKRMRGGQVGLVIYADRPFVASPLTEDARVVGLMLPELATDLMPVLDDRPDLAIARAVELLKGADAPTGRIVLIADGAGDDVGRTAAAAAAAAAAGYQVNAIGIGGAEASPYLIYDGTPLRAKDGTTLTTRLDAAGLGSVAAAGGGIFTPARADGADLERIYAGSLSHPLEDVLKQSGLAADRWADMGPYLLLGVLILAPLAFRRGWIAVLLVGALVPGALPLGGPLAGRAQAAEVLSAEGWRNLWLTPDQQGAAAFAQQDYAAAAGLFEDPVWRANALYRAGEFAAAADAFAGIPGGDYNRGNALARAGRLEEAVAAYDTALAADPSHEDAAYNRDLLRKLLEKQKQEEEKKQQGSGSGDEPSKGGGQGKGGEQGKDGQQKQDQGKPDPQKQGADQPPQDKTDAKDQKPAENDKAKSGQDKKDKDKNDQDKNDQDKNEPDKNDKAKSGQDKKDKDKKEPKDQDKKDPAEEKKDQAQGEQPPAPPKPGQQPPGPKPPAAQASGLQKPPPQQQPPPQQPPPSAAALARAKAEQDQTGEQMLRMVPDDPAGLLRARIRSHYFGTPPGTEPR
ncbi:VWA domain-containing protein [Xanthobacter sp. KR7-225]|uniref:VWA domain-containing protein n=1 Tax=Xanthobacter sp. KR7-225 TaxID=3156613 RepID=UPI0032B58CD5